MNACLLTFILAQIGFAVVASRLDDYGMQLNGYVFNGVLAAQFALLGIWSGIGIGDHRVAFRLAIAVVGIVGLCAVAETRSAANGWELLLALIRLPVFGVVYSSIRRKRNLVFRHSNEFISAQIFRLTLKQLFVFTFGVAAFLTLDRMLQSYSGPWYSVFLVVAIVMVGLGGSLVPLVASFVTLSKRNVASAVISVFVILLLATSVAAFAYSQTDSWRTASQWFALSLVEAVVISTSILLLRLFGYGLMPDRGKREATNTPHVMA